MRNDETRRSEDCAREALDRYYRAQGIAPQWQRGPDPPDWWVDLDGTRFAAEVTRVFGNINPAGHSGYRPAEEQRKFVCKLCSEIRSLIASIPESGSHYIHIQAMMISDLERAAILVQTREYVLRHLLDSQAAAEVIFKKEGAGTYAAISIEKKTNKVQEPAALIRHSGCLLLERQLSVNCTILSLPQLDRRPRDWQRRTSKNPRF